MPEENAETKPAETPGTETPPSDKGPQSIAELPEWVQKEIKDLRAESANYRTKFREAEEAVKSAKTAEEFEAAMAERDAQIEAHEETIAKKELAIVRGDLAKTHNLPDAVANLLSGTAEEMEAQAKELSQHISTPASAPEPGSLKGGLNPGEEDDNTEDPKAVAAAYMKRRYGR